LKTQSIDEVLRPLDTELNNLVGEKKLFEHRPKLGREIYRQKRRERKRVFGLFSLFFVSMVTML
jgi:hypothetical protein